jgi:methionyl-tRNA synthetase
MADKPRYYLTTAIAYPNGPPHIGHAYEAIATDAIARFMRLDGYDVLFLTGTDEHGIKMLQTAAKEKLTPQQLVECNVPRFKAMVERLNCSNDEFIRTTEERHHRASIGIWQRMEAAGDIYLGKYSGWYSVRDEAYYDEEETRINERGERVGPQGTPVEWVEEESYFFKLSAYQQKLLDLYERYPDFVLPKERLNEVMAFVKGGLQDLSISRTTFDWGVKVPGNPKHVMYVWVDALTNYITAVGYPDVGNPKFRRYWPADLHVIGKDIVRFHAVYWPAFLMSAGNVVDPFALADAFGVDQMRYFFLREVPFGQDGNYSLEAIVNRINADLANDLGNLAQRSLTMIARQRGGVLPTPGAFSSADMAMLAMADGMIAKAREAIKTQQLHLVLSAVWAVVAEANRYFAGEAPWALAKTDPTRQGTVLYVTAEVIRQVAILAQPFMPTSAAKLLDLLAIPPDERQFDALGAARRIAADTALPAPTPVFPRYIESAESAQSQC